MLGVESYDHGSTLRVLVKTSKEMRNKNQFRMVTIVQEKRTISVINGRRKIMLSHGTSRRKRYEWLESVGVVILTTMDHFGKKMEEQQKENALIPYYKERMEKRKHILISLN